MIVRLFWKLLTTIRGVVVVVAVLVIVVVVVIIVAVVVVVLAIVSSKEIAESAVNVPPLWASFDHPAALFHQ